MFFQDWKLHVPEYQPAKRLQNADVLQRMFHYH